MEPYFTINNNRSGVPVTEFLENMEKNFDRNMRHAYRVKNYQGTDKKYFKWVVVFATMMMVTRSLTSM